MRNPILVLMLLLCLQQPVMAQLYSATEGSVVYGHHHINTTDAAAHKRFWIEGLGGKVITIGSNNREVIAFPDVLVFLTDRQPTGGTRGTIVNHVGFETTDIYPAVARLREMGYQLMTQQELPDTYTVVDGIGKREGGNTLAYVLGPDDIKVELIENKSNTHAIQMHHIHWASSEGEAMQAWYVEHFGAAAGSRIGQPAADLPGVNLTFGPAPAPTTPTAGTVLDHIGFEVDNLEAFCRALEAKGINFDRPYTEVPALGIAIAFFTDPWGTYIELTEGLDSAGL